MTFDELGVFYDTLIGDSTVTNLVSSSNIFASWRQYSDSFPCIVLEQIDGGSMPQLGYVHGGKRRNTGVIQINIFSKRSPERVYEISDAVDDALLPSPTGIKGVHKVADRDFFDEEHESYGKLLRYSYFTDIS